MSQDWSAAFTEGYNAQCNDVELKANPYTDEMQHKQWAEGWEASFKDEADELQSMHEGDDRITVTA